MPARLGGRTIWIRRNGRPLRTIERNLFNASDQDRTDFPGAVGTVNYKTLAQPVYQDAAGLFIEQSDEGRIQGFPMGSWRQR
jgi:hypothetical protein